MNFADLAIQPTTGQNHMDRIARIDCIGRTNDMVMVIAGDSIPAFERLQRAHGMQATPGIGEPSIGLLQAPAHGLAQASCTRIVRTLLCCELALRRGKMQAPRER